MNYPPKTANHARWNEDGGDEGAYEATSKHEIRREKTTARESSRVDDDELEESRAGDCAKGEDSPQLNLLSTQEELVILTRKIFGDEDEEVDVAFWDDGDGALWAAQPSIIQQRIRNRCGPSGSRERY